MGIFLAIVVILLAIGIGPVAAVAVLILGWLLLHLLVD